MRASTIILPGQFNGGEIEPGTFHGGEIEPGTFHGGEIEPGTFHGGEIEPGTFHCCGFPSDAFIAAMTAPAPSASPSSQIEASADIDANHGRPGSTSQTLTSTRPAVDHRDVGRDERSHRR